jgi:hypothetical protein
MTRWYWRDGTPAIPDALSVNSPEWREAIGRIDERMGDNSYRVVGRTVLPNGRLVSTVWLGLDHAFPAEWKGFQSGPIIFESMVLADADSVETLDCRRYSTEAQAQAGHAELVAQWGES